MGARSRELGPCTPAVEKASRCCDRPPPLKTCTVPRMTAAVPTHATANVPAGLHCRSNRQPCEDGQSSPEACELAGDRQSREPSGNQHHRRGPPRCAAQRNSESSRPAAQPGGCLRRSSCRRTGQPRSRRRPSRGQRPSVRAGETDQQHHDEHQQGGHEQGGKQLSADQRIADGTGREGLEEDRQRHVSRAGIMLAVKQRRIHAARAGGLRGSDPDALSMGDAIVVVDVERSQARASRPRSRLRPPIARRRASGRNARMRLVGHGDVPAASRLRPRPRRNHSDDSRGTTGLSLRARDEWQRRKSRDHTQCRRVRSDIRQQHWG